MVLKIEGSPFPTVAACLLDSYARRVGRELLHRSGDSLDDAQRLLDYEAIVLSHDAGGDPHFVYANSAAASLWRMSIEDIIGMPSRLSAPPNARDDRARMLSDAGRDGVLAGYSGERVASDGTRFWIMDATLWTVDGYSSGPGQKRLRAVPASHHQARLPRRSRFSFDPCRLDRCQRRPRPEIRERRGLEPQPRRGRRLRPDVVIAVPARGRASTTP